MAPVHSVPLLVLLWSAQDRPSPAEALTGVEKTAHFEIRFRPGSRAEASVDRVAVLVEEDLARILEALEFRDFKDTIRLFLYDDEGELRKITGVAAGGYSTTLETHVPHDNDQTRLHELVHVVAERLPEHGKGKEPRNLFFAEGLSNAILRFVHGVPVDAVAAYEKRRGRLPTLEELHSIEDFYAWLGAHPGFNGYDVGGSYFSYLLDTFGAKKVRRYVHGVSAQEAFGKGLREIEKGWHARLDAFRTRPGLEALLKERGGEASSYTMYVGPEERLTEAVLGDPKKWRSLADAPLGGGDPAVREVGGSIRVSGAKSQGDWSICRVGSEPLGDGMVRATAEPLEGCQGVQVQLGIRCQAMVLGMGSFLYNEARGVAFDEKVKFTGKPVDLVLRRKGGRASVWIDGRLVLEADVEGSPAPLGVGCVSGPARFRDLRIRGLDGSN
ncbi:MAG TPA: hypothetical protein VFI25_17245 [Planctomycetota bacterium]|jgi:hypothetical protein|nr:hypothetical protein [Planctomycetota bacterium]